MTKTTKHFKYQSRFQFVSEEAKPHWHFDSFFKSTDLIHVGLLKGDWSKELVQARFSPRQACRKAYLKGKAHDGLCWNELKENLKINFSNEADRHWENMHLNDLKSWGYSTDLVEHMSIVREDIPQTFLRLPQKMFLNEAQIDIIKQMPGQVTPLHTDTRHYEYNLRRIY